MSQPPVTSTATLPATKSAPAVTKKASQVLPFTTNTPKTSVSHNVIDPSYLNCQQVRGSSRERTHKNFFKVNISTRLLPPLTQLYRLLKMHTVSRALRQLKMRMKSPFSPIKLFQRRLRASLSSLMEARMIPTTTKISQHWKSLTIPTMRMRMLRLRQRVLKLNSVSFKSF